MYIFFCIFYKFIYFVFFVLYHIRFLILQVLIIIFLVPDQIKHIFFFFFLVYFLYLFYIITCIFNPASPYHYFPISSLYTFLSFSYFNSYQLYICHTLILKRKDIQLKILETTSYKSKACRLV